MEPRIYLLEVIVAVYALMLSAVVTVFHNRIEMGWIYLVYHALVLGMMASIAGAHRKFGGKFWTLLRYWCPLFILLASFRELNFLIPPIHPFETDHYWDKILGGIDHRLFGTDPENVLSAITWPPLSDVLSFCYLMYFPMPMILGIALYRAGELRKFRYCTAGLFLAWYLSYAGYLLIPAVGPHRMMESRPPGLDGLFFGKIAHAIVRGGEWDMPNAFPSGHALITMVTLAYAYTMRRKVFRMLLPLGCGLLLATVYLRYHYVSDVLASAVLFPIVMVLARKFFGAWEGERPPGMLHTGF